ncbi:MAG: HNH endonuclease family protein [Actinophytocola sp.]|uniref:HNH endonuclease family protein n=1 Tax=Actinophytocola sp. TaxID=1872138 RepID=UPI003D6A9397
MRTTTTTTTTMTVLAALAVLTASGCDPTAALPTPAAGAQSARPDLAASLSALPVRPEDTTAPYDRDEWGDWASHGHGCNTREIVLTEQGHGTQPGSGCRPVCPPSGPACWTSPYDGARIRDTRRVQIDHRVPLGEAARSGAADWTRAQRERFYNDRNNLVAASVHSNTSKGDDDPARWRPTDRAAWCGYATAYVTTKHTYGLSVDRPERDALAAMLATCRRS